MWADIIDTETMLTHPEIHKEINVGVEEEKKMEEDTPLENERKLSSELKILVWSEEPE